MPQSQIIDKNSNAWNQAAGISSKLVGKVVGRAGGHCVAGSGAKSHRTRCVERNLQHRIGSQTGLYHRKCGLPVGRNYSPGRNRYPGVVNQSKETPSSSGTLTCPPTFRLPSTPRCRKSLSMIDLTTGGIDREIGDLRADSGSNSVRDATERTMEHGGVALTAIHCPNGQNVGWTNGSGSGDVNVQSTKNIDKAGSIVCHLLAINAWRRRREEVAALQQTAEQLGQQVDHLHIQIVVLRRLLHTENCRVEKLGNEVHRVNGQLEDAARERDAYRTENEKLEDELKRSKIESEERTVATENVRNELMTTKAQVQALDSQITRDRQKLLKLREDKKILLDKVSSVEALAEERGVRAERAEASVEELEARLTAREAVVDALKEDKRKCSRDLKATETEKLRLEKRLRSSEDAGRALSLRAANLEMQLSDREAALRRTESAYNLQLKELTDLREQLRKQSREGGWSSRVLQIAGSVVWAPRAILRSLSFLSTTGAP